MWDVVAHCPSIRRSSALAALKKLAEEGLIIREGSGRSTFYARADSKYFSSRFALIWTALSGFMKNFWNSQ